LGALKAAGLVHELHLDTEHHHYEMESEDGHSHVVCLSCGRVIEIDTAAFAAMAARAAEARGFEISSARVELTGYCADCRARAAV
jgi:Fe2+ or Zn2+ uptake regulation protein